VRNRSGGRLWTEERLAGLEPADRLCGAFHASFLQLLQVPFLITEVVVVVRLMVRGKEEIQIVRQVQVKHQTTYNQHYALFAPSISLFNEIV